MDADVIFLLYLISIHAPREGGDRPVRSLVAVARISIHAPREGGDRKQGIAVVSIKISIHAPREGGDSRRVKNNSSFINFNPRPPRGGRL